MFVNYFVTNLPAMEKFIMVMPTRLLCVEAPDEKLKIGASPTNRLCKVVALVLNLKLEMILFLKQVVPDELFECKVIEHKVTCLNHFSVIQVQQ